MIRETLDGLQGEPTAKALEHAAQTIADATIRAKSVLLDKRGKVNKFDLEVTFGTLARESRRDAYHTNNGRPVRFVPFSYTTGELVRIMLGKDHGLEHTLTDYINLENHYRLRAPHQLLDELPVNEKRQLDGVMTTQIVAHFVDFIFNRGESARYPIKIRRALQFFGNPPVHTEYDNVFGARDREEDIDYPMLVPVFNIDASKDMLAADVPKVLSRINQKYEDNKDEIESGRTPFSRFLTPTEICISEESWAIVELVEAGFYQNGQLPFTTMVVAAPLTPYDALRARSGSVQEHWLGHGNNDELLDELLGTYRETI